MLFRIGKLFCIVFLIVLVSAVCSANTQEEKIKTAIRQYVAAKNTAWSKSKILISFRMNQKVSLRLDTYGKEALFKVPEIYPNSKITSNMILPIQVLENNVERERIFIQVNIQVFQNVVVAQSKFKTGDVINAKQLKVQERDVLKLRDDYYISVVSLAGKQAKRLIQKDAVIVKNMIKRIPIIAKNDKVKILIRESGIRIDANGIALQEGLTGETIKVKRLNSKKIIEAKVVSAGIVEVEI